MTKLCLSTVIKERLIRSIKGKKKRVNATQSTHIVIPMEQKAVKTHSKTATDKKSGKRG